MKKKQKFKNINIIYNMNHFTMLNALLFVSLMAITQVWASPIEVQDAQKEAVKAWCSSYAQESQAHNALV